MPAGADHDPRNPTLEQWEDDSYECHYCPDHFSFDEIDTVGDVDSKKEVSACCYCIENETVCLDHE